jgi:hypothetical protein
VHDGAADFANFSTPLVMRISTTEDTKDRLSEAGCACDGL